VLFGDYNPAGRTVHTWPRSIDQLPPMMDYDIRRGRTYMYFKGDPLYPFGFGLSYTAFAYSGARLAAARIAADAAVDLSVDVKNTGSRAGEEVVQVYAAYEQSKVARPIRQLVGFRRVPIAPGEAKTVVIPIEARRLAYWDVARQAFVLEPGRVRLSVGASSADIRQQVTLEAGSEAADLDVSPQAR
jgi:beta-glucosidase